MNLHSHAFKNKLKSEIVKTEELKWSDIFKNIRIYSDDGIPLNKRGSGIKRLVLLSFFRAAVERKKNKKSASTIYAIEEPETSQSIENQKLLVKALKELSENKTQIFLTTHSTQIVKSLLPRIKNSKPKSKIPPIQNSELEPKKKFIVKKDNKTSTISEEYKKAFPISLQMKLIILLLKHLQKNIIKNYMLLWKHYIQKDIIKNCLMI